MRIKLQREVFFFVLPVQHAALHIPFFQNKAKTEFKVRLRVAVKLRVV